MDPTSPIQELHAQAMNKAELAELAKLRGEKSAQQDLRERNESLKATSL